MSFKTAQAAMLVAGLVSQAWGFEATPNTDVTWDYTNHGTDWAFANCNVATDYQSPRTITSTTMTDWTLVGDYSFLPSWKAATVATADRGFENQVYQVNATDGNMGGFYAVESYVAPSEIYWQLN